MNAISYTAARANLANTMKKVCADHAPVIITRKNKALVVMMSLEDYAAMQETTYLLRSPANARRLLESITELEAGQGHQQTLVNESLSSSKKYRFVMKLIFSSHAWDDYLF